MAAPNLLLMYSFQSIGWLDGLLERPVPTPTDQLAEWRDMTQLLYAPEDVPAARQFVRDTSGIVDSFPPWTSADITALLTHFPTPTTEEIGRDVRLERYERATVGAVADQQERVRALLQLLQQERRRLESRDTGGHADETPLAEPGALPPAYLATVVGTLSVPHLAAHGGPWKAPVAFAAGLTEAECAATEARIGFRFPPDLRSLLQYALPVGRDFPNWRDDAAHEVQLDLDWLLRGIWGDIDYRAPWSPPRWKTFSPPWSPTWGPMPAERDAAYAIISEQFARAPRLIRLYGHRFIPDTPAEAGNPVYSIVQTDIIHLGNDLADYFANEFGVPRPAWAADIAKEIAFWSELVRLNDG